MPEKHLRRYQRAVNPVKPSQPTVHELHHVCDDNGGHEECPRQREGGPSRVTTSEASEQRAEKLKDGFQSGGRVRPNTATQQPTPSPTSPPPAAASPSIESTDHLPPEEPIMTEQQEQQHKQECERRTRRKQFAPTASDDEDDAFVEKDRRTHGSYIQNDGYVRRDFNALWTLLWAFAEKHFSFDLGSGEPVAQSRREAWRELKVTMSDELIRVAGVIAVGGPRGEAGWKELFVDSAEWRVMLVAGVIWRMLKEHVFNDLVFGGTKKMEQELVDAMWGNRHLDGFARQSDRARLVQEMCDDPFEVYKSNTENGLPREFGARVDEVWKGLWFLLRPILALDSNYPDSASIREQAESLRAIVVKAGHLSLVMRINSNSLYHFPLNPKDELFDDVGYIVYNEDMMKATNPLFVTEYNPSMEVGEEQMAEEYGKSALVRVAIYDSLAVYRQGGWWGVNVDQEFKKVNEEEAEKGKKDKKPAKGKGKGKQKAVEAEITTSPNGRGEDEDILEKGFRVRKLARARVGLRWGYQRQFGEKAGKRDEGYRELKEVVGRRYL